MSCPTLFTRHGLWPRGTISNPNGELRPWVHSITPILIFPESKATPFGSNSDLEGYIRRSRDFVSLVINGTEDTSNTMTGRYPIFPEYPHRIMYIEPGSHPNLSALAHIAQRTNLPTNQHVRCTRDKLLNKRYGKDGIPYWFTVLTIKSQQKSSRRTENLFETRPLPFNN